MLKYTGHPLVDVGVATITVFAKKSDPVDVTTDDLNDIAAYIEQEYSKNPMRSFLNVIFPNSGFANANMKDENRKAYAQKVLRSWQSSEYMEETCVYFGTPARLRVFQGAIPLVASQNNFNFFGEGTSGLPVSGEALLAIQAAPLGGSKCGGWLLIIHADNPKVTYLLTSISLRANQSYLNLAAQADTIENTRFPRTQIIDRLVSVEQTRDDYETGSITAYRIFNDMRSPKVEMYHLPLQITRFLASVTDATYRKTWQRIVGQAWEGDNGEAERNIFGLSTHRNVLYEDLFALPRDARRFLRTYILRMPRLQTSKNDPRARYQVLNDLDLVSWPLTTLFLKEVMNVDETRIEAIREMADKLAIYIHNQKAQRLFNNLLYGGNSWQNYQELRTRLIRADYNQIKNDEPLFTLDQFVAVFENSDNQYTWTLARDLLTIRIIERLYELDKELIKQFRESISEEEADLEEE